MTSIDTTIADRTRTVAVPFMQAIQVCWTSRHCLKGHRVRRFVLMIEPRSQCEAMVEAWIEHGERASDRKVVLQRLWLPIETTTAEQLLHIDVYGHNGDGRIAAISMLKRSERTEDRLLFAQTKLLATAGFLAGAYDPPHLAIRLSHDSDRKRSG